MGRALVLSGSGRWPRDDVALALLAAGVRTVVAPAEAMARFDDTEFDAVFLDAATLRRALPSRIAFRVLVLLNTESPFLETPPLLDLLDASVDRDAVAVAYWVACPEAHAVLPPLDRLHAFSLRYPAAPGRFRPPVLRELRPADASAWLEPAPAPVPLAAEGRILFGDPVRPPHGPLAEQPATGGVDVGALKDVAARLFEPGRLYLPKARAMAAFLAARGLRWPDDRGAWRGLAELFERIETMNVRLPLLAALRGAFGDRVAAEGPVPGSICVDLGSRRLDTGWHGRPRDVVAAGGVLLRPDRPDGDAVLGPGAPVFGDAADLVARAEALLAGRSVADPDAVRAHAAAVAGPARIGAELRSILEPLALPGAPVRLALDPARSPGWAGGLVRRQRDTRDAGDRLATSLELMAAGGTDPALLDGAAESIVALGGDAESPLAAVDARPETAGCGPAARLGLAAAVAARQGDDAAMEAHARDSLALRWDDTVVSVVARRRLPGPDYVAWLGHLHRRLRPAAYLEIGVLRGTTLALAAEETVAIGVDPRPLLPEPRPAHWRVHPVTSDAFFAAAAFRDIPGPGELPRPDLVFLDGLHLFEQTLRDFVNAERAAHRGTVLCIHDCLAFDGRTARRRRVTDFWSGDVWKMVPILLEHRPDLTVSVVPAHPTGLVVVTGLDPESGVLDARFDAIVAAWGRRRFVPGTRRGWPVVANDWDAIEPALAARGYPSTRAG